MSKMNHTLRRFYNACLRRRLKNTTFSLISSNCNGGSILRDLGLPYNTPFIGLFMQPDDFVRLCGNLSYYLSLPLEFTENCREGSLSYPVGVLDDVKIYFMHYTSAQEAAVHWNTRKKRVNYENLFFLFSDQNACSYKTLQAFDALPCKNKAIFCNREYPEFPSAQYIPGFEGEESVGVCLYYKNSHTYKKYYDAFDYVSWFNNGR